MRNILKKLREKNLKFWKKNYKISHEKCEFLPMGISKNGFYQWEKNFFWDKKSFFLIALTQPHHFSDWSLAIKNVDFPEFLIGIFNQR